MSFGIKLKVWGDYACFTRPEMKVERVSYDVMTPSAARGILEAIYWKPSIRWVIDRITVLNPVRFRNIRRNEVSSKIPAGVVKSAMKGGSKPVELFIEDVRQQRAAMILQDVAYIIEARFEIVSNEDANPGKHLDMFNRRARKGQCFQQPYLGCREFPANFELIESETILSELKGTKELGWMLHDIDFESNMEARFFNAVMDDGVINIPPLVSSEVRS